MKKLLIITVACINMLVFFACNATDKKSSSSSIDVKNLSYEVFVKKAGFKKLKNDEYVLQGDIIFGENKVKELYDLLKKNGNKKYSRGNMGYRPEECVDIFGIDVLCIPGEYYKWDANEKMSLSYKFTDFSDGAIVGHTVEQIKAAFREAVRVWMSVGAQINIYEAIPGTPEFDEPRFYVAIGGNAYKKDGKKDIFVNGRSNYPHSEGLFHDHFIRIFNTQTNRIYNQMVGTMIHELGHTLGLAHEHQRDESDNTYDDQGNKGKPFGSYDLDSVMHYRNKPYIHLMDKGRISEGDRATIRHMYGVLEFWKATGDFDGNGTTDMLKWFDQTGHIYIGRANSDRTFTWEYVGTAFGGIPVHENAWRFTGDFNGDGRTDIGFWYGGDGYIWLGISNGSGFDWTSTPTNWGGSINTSFVWKFTGDFDGNGKTDIGFWSGANGNIWLGLSNGSQINFSLAGNASTFGNIPESSDAWKFIGDFDGNGKTDIGFWYGGDGKIFYGLSNGSQINFTLAGNANNFGNIPASTDAWRFTGDFDGDGKTDIGFWYSGDGNVWFGLSNESGVNWTLGGNAIGFGNIPSNINTWRYVGDFDGNGTTDLGFWHGADGNIYHGLTNNTTVNFSLVSNQSGFGNIPADNLTWKFIGDFDGDKAADIGFWHDFENHIWFGYGDNSSIHFQFMGAY